MKNLTCRRNAFFSEQSGQDLVEYALFSAFLAFGAVALIAKISTALQTVFTSVISRLGSAV